VRVALVSESYPPILDGVAEQVYHLARALRRLGHDPRVITGHQGRRRRSPAGDPQVIRLAPSRPLYQGGLLSRATVGSDLEGAVATLLDPGECDVVHVHAPLQPSLPLLALHRARVPVVATFHAPLAPLPGWRGRALRRHLDRIDVAVAVSQTCAQSISPSLDQEVRLVPSGVDLGRFRGGRPLSDLDDGAMNVLWRGTLDRRGGFEVALAALGLMAGEQEVRLLAIGEGPLLPMRRAQVPRRLAERVIFACPDPADLPDWYASAHACWVSAGGDGFSQGLFEAMAAERAIVATDLPAHREWMSDGYQGELVAPDDPEALAGATLRLAREPRRALAYGERGRRTAGRFDLAAMAQRLLEIYRSLHRASR
jgi:phosphatidylinositol alpha-mannosyltransferase